MMVDVVLVTVYVIALKMERKLIVVIGNSVDHISLTVQGQEIIEDLIVTKICVLFSNYSTELEDKCWLCRSGLRNPAGSLPSEVCKQVVCSKNQYRDGSKCRNCTFTHTSQGVLFVATRVKKLYVLLINIVMNANVNHVPWVRIHHQILL